MFNRIKNMLYRSLENREISYKKLQELILENKDAILLDVRSKQEFAEGHLNHAINIPVYDLEQNIGKIPNKQSVIIIYCASGHRSKRAKEKLEKMGYEKIYHLKGGLEGM